MKTALTRWWSAQGLGDTAQVDDDCLDTIPFAFDLGLKTLHFVTIEGIGDILQE